MVDRDHPDVGDTIGLSQYLSLGHVMFQSQKGRPMFEHWFAQTHGDARRVEVLAHSFLLLCPLVVGTRRLATLHTRLALQMAETLPVRLVRLDFEVPLFSETLQWHRYRDLDPGSLWLRELIVQHALKLPPLPAG